MLEDAALESQMLPMQLLGGITPFVSRNTDDVSQTFCNAYSIKATEGAGCILRGALD